MEGIGLKTIPVIGRHLLCHSSMFGSSPNSPNREFKPPSIFPPTHPLHLPLPSYSSTPYNMPSVILQWFSKNLLKIQQCKLASRNSYKTLAKRLFQLYIQYTWHGYNLAKGDCSSLNV